ncbi:MAG TPA: DUF58 domain-containing protein [Deltaproteobacteria bacterium]|nr:DUF58 domain-containing protein [Deltaproteobacteria bacterium]
MLPPEILKKIKRIQLKTNYLANEIFSGEYESAFRGRGMEFEEVREYQPGDEIRSIDWNVTARMGRPFVKVYREEREMTVMILVDMSASLDFGTRERFKRETAAEVAAVLAYAAIKSNDKVGLILFTDRVEKFIPAKKGKGHVYRVIQEVLTFKPRHSATHLQVPLEYLIRVMHRRSICFLISDFLDDGYEKALAVAKRRHDMVCIQLFDSAEGRFPKAGWILWKDPESGEEHWTNTSSRFFQRRYEALSKAALSRPRSLFQSLGVDSVVLRQSEDYIQPLLQFFRARERRQ